MNVLITGGVLKLKGLPLTTGIFTYEQDLFTLRILTLLALPLDPPLTLDLTIRTRGVD